MNKSNYFCVECNEYKESVRFRSNACLCTWEECPDCGIIFEESYCSECI